MEEYTDNQYDDDLTIGSEEYDDSYYTGAEDLFEVPTDEQSPISRLKSLILSIDWEITDEVLLLFNEELVSLRDTWAEEKINLVYVQALEKISKYIYYKKADSHPSAIKLLLTLYHNLEKVVTNPKMPEEQKKEILFEDVKRFEQLKAHIKKDGLLEPAEDTSFEQVEQIEETAQQDELRNLKAIVLGIDWEITDEDLTDLSEEVVRLEQVFTGNKPRLILLQGIGTLGAYIKLKKSDTHAEAFKVLHLFFESLEKIVSAPMSLDAEKEILFPAVEKFNSFKTLIGSTITPEAIAREEGLEEENLVEDLEFDVEEETGGVITPAFADLPEDEVRGFQADEEAQALGYESPEDVVSHVADFFPDESEREESSIPVPAIGEQEAPADEGHGDDAENGLDDQVDSGVGDELFAQSLEETGPDETGIDLAGPAAAELAQVPAFDELDSDLVLQGVDVETDADDDSDEEGLPQIDGELAPALSLDDNDLEVDDGSDKTADSTGSEDSDDIEGAIADFFGGVEISEEPRAQERMVEEPASSEVTAEPSEPDLSTPAAVMPAMKTDQEFPEDVSPPVSVDKDIALQGVEVETEADDDSGESPLPTLGEGLAPALALEDEITDNTLLEETPEGSEEESVILDTVDDFFDDIQEPAQSPEAALADADEEEVLMEDTSSTEESEEISEFVERLDNFFGETEQEEIGLESAPVMGSVDDADGLVAALSGLEETDEQFELDEDEEVVFELVEDDDLLDITEITLLQDCVGSLGMGQDETALKELGSEIEKLSEKCAERPVDLALLKVVASLVEKYGDISGSTT